MLATGGNVLSPDARAEVLARMSEVFDLIHEFWEADEEAGVAGEFLVRGRLGRLAMCSLKERCNIAKRLHGEHKKVPITSPHGHTGPRWFYTAATLAGLRLCPGKICQGIAGQADPHTTLGNRVYRGNFRGSTELCAVGISRQYSPAHGGTPLIHPPPDSGA